MLEADPLDSDALITFIQSTTKQVGFLKWPLSEDHFWIDFKFNFGHNRASYPLWEDSMHVAGCMIKLLP